MYIELYLCSFTESNPATLAVCVGFGLEYSTAEREFLPTVNPVQRQAQIVFFFGSLEVHITVVHIFNLFVAVKEVILKIVKSLAT